MRKLSRASVRPSKSRRLLYDYMYGAVVHAKIISSSVAVCIAGHAENVCIRETSNYNNEEVRQTLRRSAIYLIIIIYIIKTSTCEQV